MKIISDKHMAKVVSDIAGAAIRLHEAISTVVTGWIDDEEKRGTELAAFLPAALQAFAFSAGFIHSERLGHAFVPPDAVLQSMGRGFAEKFAESIAIFGKAGDEGSAIQ